MSEKNKSQQKKAAPPRVREKVLDPATHVVATLAENQCPGCGHVSKKPVRLGPPRSVPCRGVFDGVEFSVVIRQRVVCEKCHQHFFEKTFK